MKQIKIEAKNAKAIEAALAEVNGRATAHAYTDYSEIEAMAKAAENELADLGINKKDRAGAEWGEVSGGAVANAYTKKGYSRTATKAWLKRTTTGWVLAGAYKTEIGKQGGGFGWLTLTAKQDELAVANLRTTYRTKAPAQA